MKVTVSHALMPEGMELLEKTGADVYIADSSDPYEYIEHIQESDILILRMGEFRRPIIEKCRNLKAIGITGIGYDHVDVAAATEYGIPVIITPGANQHCVAETVIAYIMAFSKNLFRQSQELHAGHWEYRDEGKGFELFGKTVGFVGCGKIASSTIAICNALGMKTIGYDILGREQAEKAGCEYRDSMDDIFRESDFVSIHVTLTPETRNLVTAKQLALMKPSAYLINIARGPIVNEHDLCEALNNDRIAGAAVDVFCVEPTRPEDPIFKAKNLITTPHTAGIAREAITRMSTMCVEGCNEVAHGRPSWQAVDQRVFEHPRFKALCEK